MKRILIAGIGNIFHGDDAFGCEVIAQLKQRALPPEVEARDFSIRSFDLAYALTDEHDAVILVDAVSRNQPPGTVFLIEPDLSCLKELGGNAADPHTMNPVSVIRMAQALGGVRGKFLLVGCEPAILDDERGELGLSEPVQAAMPQAIAMIESVIDDFLNKPQETNAGSVPA